MTERFNYQQLRSTCFRLREGLSHARQNNAAEGVFRQLIDNENYLNAHTIAFYQAHRGELSLARVLEHAWQANKHTYFPITQLNHTLLFAKATDKTVFVPNRYGILEPVSDTLIACHDLEMILMPLTIFDNQGNRLGTGGGYYDRTLQTACKPKKIGIAYDFQHVCKLTPAPWDVALDGVVTPNTIFHWSR